MSVRRPAYVYMWLTVHTASKDVHDGMDRFQQGLKEGATALFVDPKRRLQEVLVWHANSTRVVVFIAYRHEKKIHHSRWPRFKGLVKASSMWFQRWEDCVFLSNFSSLLAVL